MFLDEIGDCDECERRAFFEHEDTKYCIRHSSRINGTEPDEVEELANELGEINGIQDAESWPLAFVIVVPSSERVPWAVHSVSNDHGYRVSDEELEQEFIVEPKDATVAYRDLEEFLSR